MKQNIIQKLTDAQHILTRSGMYIGDATSSIKETYIIEDNKIALKGVEYNPGFLKIIDEIIDNSIDEAIRTNFKYSTNISITYDTIKQEFSISDDGRGLPQTIVHDNIPMAVIAFTEARAGSNFSDDTKANGIGTNGIGSFLTNVFSKSFIVKTSDGENELTLESINNAESYTYSIKKSKKQGTTVSFIPDLERFGITITDEYFKLIQNRCFHLAQSFPEIKFHLDFKKKFNIGSLPTKKYIEMFSSSYELIQNDNYFFAVLPNEFDDFKVFSYVNGLNVSSGGSHVDYISNEIVSRVRENLLKKYKLIKPGDIKNKIMIVAVLKDFSNLKFDSQTKERVTNPLADVRSYYGDIDFDALVKKLMKNSSIIEPITEVYRIKEELKKRQELKGLEKTVKKPKSEKFMPPIGAWNRLFLAEGDCLHEDTEILMADNSQKKIKDINVGEYVISGDGSIQTIKAKTKSLRETLEIKIQGEVIRCSEKHRFYVYDTVSNTFVFVEALELKNNQKKYKMLKSKINQTTSYLEVENNDVNNHIMYCKDIDVNYTPNDYFVTFRDSKYIRVLGEDIKANDLLTIND